MSTFLRITQAIDHLEQTSAAKKRYKRKDIDQLDELLVEMDGTPLHRPTEKLVRSLKKARRAERRREWLAPVKRRRVIDRLENLRAAVAIHALGVAEHRAGFHGEAA